MRKTIRKIAAAVLCTAVCVGSVPGSAASFDSLDSGTAVAGASAALTSFYATNEDAGALLAAYLEQKHGSTETAEQPTKDTELNIDEVLYDEAKVGVADVEAFLNVRQEPSTLSDVVDSLYRGAKVNVLGIVTVHGKAWYKVQSGASEGYVAGNYIIFGEAAEALAQEVQDAMPDPSAYPTECVLYDDISELPEDIQRELKKHISEVNWVLTQDLPTALSEEDDVNLFSVLIYLLEEYQNAMDIANDYELTDTLAELTTGITAVNLNMQSISENTGKTDEQLCADIAASQAEELSIAQAEADRRAQEAAAAQAAAESAAAEATREQADAAAQAAAQSQAEAAAASWAAASQAAADAAAAAAAQSAAQEAAAAQQTTPPAATGGAGADIANFAASWVGKINYVWGGNDFREGGGVDCSHFTYNVYLAYGLVGSYVYSGGQRNWGYGVSLDQIQPGDLVCYNGHVAIYYGDGMVIHAPAPGRTIEVGSLYMSNIVAVRRLAN